AAGEPRNPSERRPEQHRPERRGDCERKRRACPENQAREHITTVAVGTKQQQRSRSEERRVGKEGRSRRLGEQYEGNRTAPTLDQVIFFFKQKTAYEITR